jgi:hypothetical protein
VKTAKKIIVKATPESVATCFVKRLIAHKANRVIVMRPRPKGISIFRTFRFKGTRKFPLAGLLVAKNKDCQTLHCEAPHHTEGISLAQHKNVPPTQENREELKANDEV